MLLNVHSYYSLRYGTLPLDQLIALMKQNGYDTAVLTDINNSSAVLDYIKEGRAQDFNALAGMECRRGDKLLYIGIAKNEKGFQSLNQLMTDCNLQGIALPDIAPIFDHVYMIYPYGSRTASSLADHEYIGVKPGQLNKILVEKHSHEKYVMLQPVTFLNKDGYKLHCRLRAVDNNILLSQLSAEQVAAVDEILIAKSRLLGAFRDFPQIIRNTEKLLADCTFNFDFTEVKNKKLFTGSKYDDKLLLEKLAMDGLKSRYGLRNKEATSRVKKELEIINNLGFSAYFLITQDITNHARSRGFYYVGRGSGANSVVAYCLRITDVCPIELDLYFERFLNPKRKSPPDFDVDFCWDERDEIYEYIFKRYGTKNTALLGAMSTFKENSVIRELGKVYGLPKSDIDRILDHPDAILNNHEITDLILALRSQVKGFPNLRSIHSSGVEPACIY